MLSMCVYEKACANLHDRQEFADESCAISINIVSKMCHAVQYVVRGKTIASQDAKKHFFFFFHILGHPSSSICILGLCHWEMFFIPNLWIS